MYLQSIDRIFTYVLRFKLSKYDMCSVGCTSYGKVFLCVPTEPYKQFCVNQFVKPLTFSLCLLVCPFYSSVVLVDMNSTFEVLDFVLNVYVVCIYVMLSPLTL